MAVPTLILRVPPGVCWRSAKPAARGWKSRCLWMTSPILSTGCTRGLYLYPSSRRLAPNLYCFVIQLYKQDSPPPQNALSQFLCYSIAVLPYRKRPFLHAIRFHALTSTVSRQILNEAIHQFRLANGVAPCPPSWPGATRPAAPPRPAASPPTWAHKKRPQRSQNSFF